MNGNSIMAKIAGIKNEATELSIHNIELATVQSIDKLDVNAFKLRDKSQVNVKKAKDALINASNAISDTISAFEKVVAEVDILEKQAKDLGIGLPTEARRSKDSAVRELGNLKSLSAAINAAKF
jgi:hypothetical protein